MRIVSLNLGRPRLMRWQGTTLSSGIFKEPFAGRVMLRKTNFEGDRQADLSVHGGPEKAAYGYPSEHYPFWSKVLAGRQLPWGSFGENLSTEGMIETQISAGDRFRIGSAIVSVTTPRIPCLKLAAKFQRDSMIEEFLNSGYSGFYFSVLEEGEIGAGDLVEFVGGETPTLTVAELFRLFPSRALDVELLERATQIKSLPQSWRERFQARLAAAKTENKI